MASSAIARIGIIDLEMGDGFRVIASSESDEAIHSSLCCEMDCFAGARNDVVEAFDYPTGKSMRLALNRLSSPSGKNILIFRNQKSVYIVSHPASQEGRFAVVTDVGCGMRWTRMVLLTRAPEADGEVVWS